MGYDSHVTISVVSLVPIDGPRDNALISQSVENTAGAYNLELLRGKSSDLYWEFAGHNTDAERIRAALAEVAGHYGLTLRMVYTDDFTELDDQTVFYIGPNADLEAAADHVQAISHHVAELSRLVGERKVSPRAVSDMLDGTGIEWAMLEPILNKMIG